jgi:DNA primase
LTNRGIMQEVDLEVLKEKIDIVKLIQKHIDLKYENGEWWGLCPFHEEKTPSFSVSPTKHIYFCYGCHCGGSVIDFIAKINKVSVREAINILTELYNIPVSEIPVIIKVSKKYATKKEHKETIKMEYLENPMHSYDKEDIKEWIVEGIPQQIMDKFEVRYDKVNNTIVFPIIDHEGNLLSIKARSLSKDAKSKYYYYIKFGTVDFLYGYYQNKQSIIDKNEVIIFEGEKSVMKSINFGYPNATASMTDRIERTLENIIKIPCKNVVIAWDKGVPRTQIIKEVKKLKKYKNVYIIEDKWGLLDNKDSPVDKTKETFDFLYENRERIY